MLINIKLSEQFVSSIELYNVLRAPNVLHLLFRLLIAFVIVQLSIDLLQFRSYPFNSNTNSGYTGHTTMNCVVEVQYRSRCCGDVGSSTTGSAKFL